MGVQLYPLYKCVYATEFSIWIDNLEKKMDIGVVILMSICIGPKRAFHRHGCYLKYIVLLDEKWLFCKHFLWPNLISFAFPPSWVDDAFASTIILYNKSIPVLKEKK